MNDESVEFGISINFKFAQHVHSMHLNHFPARGSKFEENAIISMKTIIKSTNSRYPSTLHVKQIRSGTLYNNRYPNPPESSTPTPGFLRRVMQCTNPSSRVHCLSAATQTKRMWVRSMWRDDIWRATSRRRVEFMYTISSRILDKDCVTPLVSYLEFKVLSKSRSPGWA